MTSEEDVVSQDRTPSDHVRRYCAENYIQIARRKKEYVVAIRAGDLHTALGFMNRLPLIYSAVGAKTFEDENHIRRIAIDGPLNGANTLFVFRIL